MLSAVAFGDVFTSPSPQLVLHAIRSVTGPSGCLLIVKVCYLSSLIIFYVFYMNKILSSLFKREYNK